MKVAIIGCGGLGSVHANCYSKISGVELVGVCDVAPEAVQKMAGNYKTTAYTSFDDMLAQSGCEVVSVTLPSFLHKEYAMKAAAAGKHVICEKPIALNMEDAQELVAYCEQQGVRLFVGHVVRFFPEYVQMKQTVASGKLGNIGVAHAKRAGGHPGNARAWFADDAKSGGVVLDLMVHDLDFLRWTLGEVASVFANRYDEGDVDYVNATLIFESGAVANVEGFWGYPGPFHTKAEIAGSAGLVNSDSMNSKSLQIRKAVAPESGKPFVEVPQSPAYRSPFELELRHFVECIEQGKEAIVTAHDACKALEIGLAVMESVRTGKAVYLNKQEVAQ